MLSMKIRIIHENMRSQFSMHTNDKTILFYRIHIIYTLHFRICDKKMIQRTMEMRISRNRRKKFELKAEYFVHIPKMKKYNKPFSFKMVGIVYLSVSLCIPLFCMLEGQKKQNVGTASSSIFGLITGLPQICCILDWRQAAA